MKYKRTAMPNSWRSEWQICQSCAAQDPMLMGHRCSPFTKRSWMCLFLFMVPARGQLGEQLETCELQLLDWIICLKKNYVAMQKYPPPSTTSLPVLTARKSFTSIQNWEGNLGNPEQRNVHSLWSTRDFSCHRPKATLIFLHIQRIQGPGCCPAQCQGIMMHTQVRVSNWS